MKLKKFFNGIEDNFCAVVLLAMLILTFVNVVMRKIFLSSMPFVEELTRLGLMILSLVGAAVAAKRGAHLGLSVVTDLLPSRAQKYVSLFGDIVAAFFCVIIIYYGYFMALKEYTNNLRTAGMQWPEWLFGMWVGVGGIIMLVRYIQIAINEFKTKKSGDFETAAENYINVDTVEDPATGEIFEREDK